MALINSDVIPASATAYELEQSLRFNDNDSAYLSWTPSSAGNRKTWTWSGWVKRGNIGLQNHFFSAGTGSSPTFLNFGFNASDELQVLSWDYNFFETSQLFRDTSSWYHIVIVLDTSNSTASDRMRVYVNGNRVTDFSQDQVSNISQNQEFAINSTTQHEIGRASYYSSKYQEGYLAEVNFIDGQALDSSYFGETGTYGEWKPIEYTGTYGTNGFYLPFKQDYQVEGFSTTLYTGNGSTQYIGGTGFQPDLIWIKTRNTARHHGIWDSVRGTSAGFLQSSSTDPEDSGAGINSFNTDGFTIDYNSSWGYNASGETAVAWSWDMGGSNATNTDGSITSTVRANPTYGQSIVSYTGNGTAGATVGHGLSSAPEMIIVKPRSTTGGWIVYHNSIDSTAPEDYYINMDETGARSDNVVAWNDTAPTSSVFSLGSSSVVNGSGTSTIAYCFHSVSGYSKFGSYTGTGSSGLSITTGFKPAFIMIKAISSGTADNWTILDNTRSPTNPRNDVLRANASTTEYSDVSWANTDFTDTGFTINNVDGYDNGSGTEYIYMAFADTREFAYWLDQSGNNNDWTSNNLTESDISVDSPTNNFATLNPLWNSVQQTYAEGNLKTSGGSSHSPTCSSIGVSSGKWYAEAVAVSSGLKYSAGIFDTAITYNKTSGTNYIPGQDPNNVYSNGDAINYYGSADDIYKNGSQTDTSAFGSTISQNDIIQVAMDVDNGKVWFGRNNTWSNGTSANGTFNSGSPDNTFTVQQEMRFHFTTENLTWVVNFGQDSSFAGNKTAQGNTDSNGIGDFYYTPPSGYLALCTANLPDPAVIPSENFNTVIWTGNDTYAGRSITGVGFQPDFVWAKARSQAYSHLQYDVLRGTGSTAELSSDQTVAEGGSSSSERGYLNSFDSDGFSSVVGSSSDNLYFNQSSQTYVAWNWKANGSGVSNTNGSITSTVSANQDAGFSIVSYTGTGSAGTIGHGLSQAPEMIITKNRDTGANWGVYNKDIGASNGMYLSLTNASESQPSWWNSTAPTSTVFSIGTDTQANRNGDNFIAYCFHSVDGFSKVGSYTGNGSSDGTFVYTGFRVAYVMYKRSNSTGGWRIADNPRSGYRNEVDQVLRAESSSAEGNYSGTDVDFLSNGFKLRGTDSIGNTSGGTYIYIAFAENPFKYTNAR